MRRILAAAVSAGLLAGMSATNASAQLIDRPYDFPTGGPGPSMAGKQAIILNEIDPDFTPEALFRDRSGGLTFPVENPNGSDVPIVIGQDGTIVPSFGRGPREWAGVRTFGAGEFNAFFAGRSGGFGAGVRFGAFRSGDSPVSIWTARVTGAGGFAPTGNSITDWTAATYYLPPAL